MDGSEAINRKCSQLAHRGIEELIGARVELAPLVEPAALLRVLSHEW